MNVPENISRIHLGGFIGILMIIGLGFSLFLKQEVDQSIVLLTRLTICLQNLFRAETSSVTFSAE